MKKFLTICIAGLFTAFTGLANAAPKELPNTAKLTCAANADGTGVLTVAGINVKHIEVYHHNQDGTARNKDVLKSAATYPIPRSATYQVVFTDSAGTWYTNLDAVDGDNAARVFAAAASSQFNGVCTVPEAEHGGTGGPGSSLACCHMLRAKTTAK